MVFEYVEKNLLEVLEENTVGIDVSHLSTDSFENSPNACGTTSIRC